MAVVAGIVFFTHPRAARAGAGADRVLFDQKMVGCRRGGRGRVLSAAIGRGGATQRSFFMTAVVLIAVMVDRRAIT